MPWVVLYYRVEEKRVGEKKESDGWLIEANHIYKVSLGLLLEANHIYKEREPRAVARSSPLGGDYLLSHFRSTIGVVRLNFSVRNGKRWNPHAIITLVSSLSGQEGASATGPVMAEVM